MPTTAQYQAKLEAVKIQESENQIISHFEVFAERPSDRQLMVPAIEVHERRFGRIPAWVAADAGFHSQQNEKTAGANGSAMVVGAESEDEECGTQTTLSAALVSSWTTVANRLRGPHQRAETETRDATLLVSRIPRYAALGGTECDRR